MTDKTDKIDSIDELFVHELHDLYNAERQLLEALPQMVSAADAPELRDGMARHLNQTRDHLERMRRALQLVGEQPNGEICHGVAGLITEGKKLIDSADAGPVLDGAIIGAARKVEQYEISAYRSATAKAHELGMEEVASLLEMNLQDEELADYRLQQLAQGMMPYSGPGADPRDDGSEVIVGQSVDVTQDHELDQALDDVMSDDMLSDDVIPDNAVSDPLDNRW